MRDIAKNILPTLGCPLESGLAEFAFRPSRPTKRQLNEEKRNDNNLVLAPSEQVWCVTMN
ncbi:MAG: hypothetical protein CFE31_17530 [Rhizobiales bacterium PAR1]|nr:MAG: hypothetical protein CFE31_17530 [Rhizobiales bacterium PAR1]